MYLKLKMKGIFLSLTLSFLLSKILISEGRGKVTNVMHDLEDAIMLHR